MIDAIAAHRPRAAPRGGVRRSGRGGAPVLRCWGLVLVAGMLAAGCGFFGGGEPAAPEADAAPTTLPDETRTPVPGMLDRIADAAPPGSATQILARVAADLGWEAQVAQNTLLLSALQDEAFSDRIEPVLLSLFFRNGFSVLPAVGEGHQFARDSVVRGAVDSARFLVPTRERVRIIFLRAVRNVQVIYPQDGEQPQIFALDDAGVVAVRRSRLEQYLR